MDNQPAVWFTRHPHEAWLPLILSIPLGTKANATKRGIIEILMEANDDDDDG